MAKRGMATTARAEIVLAALTARRRRLGRAWIRPAAGACADAAAAAIRRATARLQVAARRCIEPFNSLTEVNISISGDNFLVSMTQR